MPTQPRDVNDTGTEYHLAPHRPEDPVGYIAPVSINPSTRQLFFSLPSPRLADMHFTTIPLLLAATLAPGVLGHGYLKEIIVDGKSYGGWQPYSDPYITPTPVRYTRVFPDNGPVPDFTTADITCNKGGNIPIANNIPVTAGSQVKFQWDQWGSSHSGPVMTYVAKCILPPALLLGTPC